MFVCLVRERDGGVKKCGSIWIVQRECDILPVYLVSIGTNAKGLKPQWPYFPVSSYLQSVIDAKRNNAQRIDNDDGLSQRILRFVPSFNLLNDRNKAHRKLRRKWSAYYKIDDS